MAGGTGQEKEGRNKFTGSRVSKKASEVRRWELATGRMIWTAEGESGAAFSLAFSPDGKSLAFCDQDYVYLIDAETGRLKQIVMETIYGVRDRLPAKSREITVRP
jgi:Tol biopolymer transport system component